MLTNLIPCLLLASVATVFSGGVPAQDAATASTAPSKAEKVTLGAPIHVVGFAVRTTNAAEATGSGEIPKLWGRFFQENLEAQIPHRIGQSLIVVYSDYASDQNGEYSYLLGAPVDSIEGLPAGLTARTIPAGSYAVVTTAKGKPQATIPAAWIKIWQMPESELGGKRSFVTDYETYDDFSDPENMQIGIHLGLTPATATK